MKDFKVTPEILELFKNEKITVKNIKKLIPDYLDYRISEAVNKNKKYLAELSEGLTYYLKGTRCVTPQRFIEDIQQLFKSDMLNSANVLCFDGEGLDGGYDIEVCETEPGIMYEDGYALLTRIAKAIRDAKKIEKESVSNSNEITEEILQKIANNPALYQKIQDLKGL